jgi:hypothetical protein
MRPWRGCPTRGGGALHGGGDLAIIPGHRVHLWGNVRVKGEGKGEGEGEG